MQQLIMIIHVLAAVAIIALVLMQHGRGADVGASFGSGASNTMFGSAGAVPFLMKVTVACAAIFYMTSISLSYIASAHEKAAKQLNIPVLPAEPVKPDVVRHMLTPAADAPSKSTSDNNVINFRPVESGKSHTKQDAQKKKAISE